MARWPKERLDISCVALGCLIVGLIDGILKGWLEQLQPALLKVREIRWA
jgi:hypothetical protein